MSWMSPLDAEREKLEGVPLNVCNDCKDMVVQVNDFFDHETNIDSLIH